MCYEMMCSEWIVSRAASEGGDGGGKVWGRQKRVVMMRRNKERKEQKHVRMYLTVVSVQRFALCVLFRHLCGSVFV